MSKKKEQIKPKKANPPNPAQPPNTERDILTGKYTVNKQQATNNWFKAAKSTMSEKRDFNWDIDPKQAVYTNKSKK